MGDCRYCHSKAGLFRDAHDTCQREAEFALEELKTFIADAITSGKSSDDVKIGINTLKEKGRLSDSDTRSALLHSADVTTLNFALQAPMTNNEADRIGNIYSTIDTNWFNDPAKLTTWSGFMATVYSNVLYQVLNGEVPYYDPTGYKDFRFDHDEHPILKRNTTLAEYRTVSTGYGYQSVSIPVGGGVYYRIGASQPRSHQTGLLPIDQGLMVITTKAIYFTGQITTFYVPYSTILRFEAFTDGYGIYENHSPGKVFIPAPLGTADEGWYFYNLVSALSKW